MDAEDFRRIALSMPGAEESSHMGAPDFRVAGRIFATLASQSKGYDKVGELSTDLSLLASYVCARRSAVAVRAQYVGLTG